MIGPWDTPSTFTFATAYPGLAAMAKAWLVPWDTAVAPEGATEPPKPADAVIVYWGEPASVTVNACVAIVMVALCALALLFDETLYIIVPLPVPLEPEVNVTQLGGLDAFHAQPAGALTVTLPAPPDGLKDAPAEERAYEHA